MPPSRKRPNKAVSRDTEALEAELVAAARENKCAEIRRLLQAGAPCSDGKALQKAVIFNHCGAVEELLKGGADPNVDDGSWSTLSIALGEQNCAIVSALLQHGANVKQADLTRAVHAFRDSGFHRLKMDIMMPMLDAAWRCEKCTAEQAFDMQKLGPADPASKWDHLHSGCTDLYCPVQKGQEREAAEAARQAEADAKAARAREHLAKHGVDVLRPRKSLNIELDCLAVKKRSYGEPERESPPSANSVLQLLDGRVAAAFDDHFVRVFSPGQPHGWYQMGGEGDAPGQFKFPAGLATDGEHLWVCDGGNGRVQAFLLAKLPEVLYEWRADAFKPGPALFASDHLIVGNRYDHTVCFFRTSCGTLDLVGRMAKHEWDDDECEVPPHSAPDALAVCDGELFVLCNSKVLVFRFADGGLLRTFGERGDAPGQSCWGHGLAVTAGGLLVISEIHGSPGRLQVLTRHGEPVQELHEVGSIRGLSIRCQQLYITHHRRLICYDINEPNAVTPPRAN